MRLDALTLDDFRSHPHLALELAPKVTLLTGPNGTGKTNVLEAIHYLCLSKSFLTSTDQYAVRNGADHFDITGSFTHDSGRAVQARCIYVPREGKRVFVNKAPLERISDVVGRFPVVVYAPDDYVLTSGGPDERRKFMNNIMSQARPRYLDDLLKYRRALKQRNHLLSRTPGSPALASWTEELVVLGSAIINARQLFLTEFEQFVNRAYEALERATEKPVITYQAPVPEPGQPLDDIQDAYRHRLQRTARRERQLGRTMAGPHLDEFVFALNDLEVRRFASQGQHRSFGLALKLAKYFYLQDRLDEAPLLLLDDIFGHFDDVRTTALLHLLESETIGQSILTATSDRGIRDVIDFTDGRHRQIALNGRAA